MADNTVLQEFLVKLGFDIKDQHKFSDALKRTEKSAIDLGARVGKVGMAIAGMGLLAAKGTIKYAQSLEQLNFVAQRTGTSLTHLRALQLAGASLGSSAEGAQSSLEGLASFMRRNPGSSEFLKSIGVQTEDAKGNALDTADVMKNLAGSFQHMKVFMAEQYAGMLGIDEKTMLAMRNPKFAAEMDKYKAAEGKGVDKAGNSAHALMEQSRTLDAHQFGLAAQAMTPAMDGLTHEMKILNKNLDDTNGALSWIMKAWSANSALGHPVEKTAAAAATYFAAKKLLGAGAGKATTEKLLGTGAEKATTEAASAGLGLSAARLGVGIGMMTHSAHLNPGEDAAMEHMAQMHAVNALRQSGLTEAQAIGMVANFSRESGMNPGAIGDHGQAYGLGQWHAPRQADFAKMFGHSIKQSTMDEQLQFAGWELKNRYASTFKKMQAAGGDARLQASIVSHGYERPRDAQGEASKRADIAQNINTTINVNGSGNPVQTAQEVARAQKQVNQQLARNTAGAIR